MNAGLSNLTRLKVAVLPAGLRPRPDWDDALVNIGLGVVEMMEGHCSRQFAFAEGGFTTDANRTVISVPRYPVAAWTAVELQANGEAWTDISGQVLRFEGASGIFCFRQPPGDAWGTLRVRYTGGFWWDESEDGTGVMPELAVPLPQALFSAWTMQVQAIVVAQDLLGLAGSNAGKGKASTLLPQAELVPLVKTLLNPFRRFAS